MGHRFAPRPSHSMVNPVRRRRGAALNGSLTIIVLTPLTTFSGRVRGPFGKRLNSLEYFYRDVGSSKGPPQARDDLTRAFAMPCADRLRRDAGPGSNPHAQHADPGARR